MAQAILLSPDAALLDARRRAARSGCSRRCRARRSSPRRSRARGALIQTRDLAEACAIANRIAPEHLELAVADPDALLPQHAPRRRDLPRPLRVRGARRLLRRARTTCCRPRRTARFSSPLGVYDFQKRSSVLARLARPARATLGRDRRDARARRGPARARASPSARCAHEATGDARRDARDDVARGASRPRDPRAARPITSPRPTGMIKLDAMENPYGLPASAARGDRGGGRRTSRSTAIPTPAATASRPRCARALALPDGVGVAARQRLGRDASRCSRPRSRARARSCWRRSRRSSCTAMYALLCRRALRRRAAARGLHARHRRDARGDRARASRRWCGSRIRTIRPATLFDAADVERDHRARRRASSSSTRPTTRSPTRRSCRACSSSRTWSSCARVSKIGMAGVRLGYAAAHPAWIAELDKVRPPYNVNALTQAVVPVLLAARRDCWPSRPRRSVPSARASRPRWRRCAGVDRVSDAGQFPARPRARTRTHWFATLRDAGMLVKNVTAWHPLLADCLRITVGTPAENDALLAALSRYAMNALAEPARRAPTAPRASSATRTRRRSPSSSNLDGTGRAELATGVPFLDHMLDQVARHGMLDLDGRAPRATCTSTRHHTVEDIGITLGQAFQGASATRRACAATATPTCRSTRRCRAW